MKEVFIDHELHQVGDLEEAVEKRGDHFAREFSFEFITPIATIWCCCQRKVVLAVAERVALCHIIEPDNIANIFQIIILAS
jgi:hypothetical protein